MTNTLELTAVPNDFVPISSSMLFPSRLCGFALFVCDKPGDPFRLFRAPNIPITVEWLRKLEESGRRKLYISTLDHEEFQHYLRENLDAVLHDETIAVSQRFASLNEVVRVVLNEAFSQGNLDATIACTEELGHQMVDLICREDVIVSELCQFMYHDYHTFTHSANVSYYTVLLAKEIGISSQEELRQIAKGALLHDLGKLEIPGAILSKPDKLTAAEYAVLQMHPTLGFRKLCRRSDVSAAQLMMVYQHHERPDGQGYPVRIGSSDIHFWALICAVADVFEALTSNRPYRSGMCKETAIQIMDRHSGTGFDGEVYGQWKALIQKS